MTEYRVVCDIERMDKQTGEIKMHKNTAPHWGGAIRHMQTFSIERAEKWLEEAKREAPIYDEYTRISESYGLLCTQSNFRIQTRYVSEWTEEE